MKDTPQDTSNSSQTTSKKSETFELIKTLFLALVVAIGLRSFVYEPFNIPSSSMVPSLLVGDFLFVAKWPYGYSRWAFPFGFPPFSGRIIDLKSPDTGDVIVFKNPKDTSSQWIKRVIGRPGDKVQMREGILYINGQEAKLERIEDYNYIDERTGESHMVEQYIETLPNGRQHLIIKDAPFGLGKLDDTPVYEVPEGYLFVMGDNRDHSGDSRAMNFLGFVPYENLLGPADFIYFSAEYSYFPTDIDWLDIPAWFNEKFIWWQPWKWFTAIRYSRIFTIINNFKR